MYCSSSVTWNIIRFVAVIVTEQISADHIALDDGNKENIDTTSNGEMVHSQQNSSNSHWSPMQIEQLEEALKEFSEDTEDRWELICQTIPQKTKVSALFYANLL